MGVWEQLYGIPRGADDFNLVGSDTHTLTEAQLAEHTHGYRYQGLHFPDAGGQYSNACGISPFSIANDIITPTGQNAPHNNLPRSQNMRMYGRRY